MLPSVSSFTKRLKSSSDNYQKTPYDIIYYVRKIFWKTDICYRSGGNKCQFFEKFYVRTKWTPYLAKIEVRNK